LIEELFRVAFGFRRGARPAQARRVQMKYTSVWAGRATKHETELARKKGWRAVPPALAEVGYGCFLPDLTRFTTMQCGAARRCSLQCERTCVLIISANGVCAASDMLRAQRNRAATRRRKPKGDIAARL